MTRNNALIISLLKAYVNEESHSIHLTPDEWKSVFATANEQGIAPLVWSALSKCDTDIDHETAMKFVKASTKAGHVYSLQNRECLRILAALGEKGIRTIHFKGTFLGQYYPEPERRISCDIDILYEKENRDAVCEIMRELGYAWKGETVKEDEWFLDPCIAVEMHFGLFGTDSFNTMKEFEPWEDVIKVGDIPNMYMMKREKQYVFLLFHFVKHLRQYGISLRQILDFEFYLRREWEQFDRDVLEALLKKNGLEQMEAAVRHLLSTWFHDGEHDKNDEALEHFLFSSGMGASYQRNREIQKVVANRKKGNKSKFYYFLHRIFPTVGEIRERYPTADKYRILTPAFYVVRWFQALQPSTRHRIQKETTTVRGFSEEEIRIAETLAELTAASDR